MYYNEYEDYMMSVLGYNNRNNANSYNENYEQNYYSMPTYNNNYTRMEDNIEDLYPDIYRIINPMVCKICQNNTRPITNELVEQMTMEIYNNIQADNLNIVNVNIETRESNNSKTTSQKQVESRETKDLKSQDKQENRDAQESRQRRPNNPLLRDLIRILILNQLLGGGFFPGRPPVRPPFPGPGGPGMPPRPPMRPPFPRPRPGMRNFDYDENLNF